MELNLGDYFDEEIKPVRATQSIQPIQASCMKFCLQTVDGVTFSPAEQALVKRELSRPTREDAEVVTLSSGEEGDDEEHWSVLNLPNDKLEGDPKVEVEERNFDDCRIAQHVGGLESEIKSGIKQSSPERFSVIDFRHHGNSRRRDISDDPSSLGTFCPKQQFETYFEFHCRICWREMASQKSLEQHIKTYHKTRPTMFGCSVCGMAIESYQSLRIHRSTHPVDRPFGCDLCKVNYRSVSQLEDHLESKEHQKKEALQIYLGDSTSDEVVAELEQSDQNNWSSSQPRLYSEVDSWSIKTREVGGSSGTSQSAALKGPSMFPGTSQETARKLASKGTPSSKHQYFPPAQSHPRMQSSTMISSSAIAGPIMSPMQQGVAKPIMFCGYMFNKGSDPGEFPSAILPKQTFKSPSAMSAFSPGIFPGNSQGNQDHYKKSSSDLSHFTCSDCQAQFSVEAHLQSHMRDEHSDFWKCPKCEVVMMTPDELAEHYGKCKKSN